MKFIKRSPKKLFWLLYFLGYIIVELLVSNVRVARDVLLPKMKMQPGVVGIPIDGDTNLEITILANLVSLTPGTLSLDVSSDRNTLFVHSMFAGDKEALIRSIKRQLERPLLEILR